MCSEEKWEQGDDAHWDHLMVKGWAGSGQMGCSEGQSALVLAHAVLCSPLAAGTAVCLEPLGGREPGPSSALFCACSSLSLFGE